MWSEQLKKKLIGEIMAILGQYFKYEMVDSECDWCLDFRCIAGRAPNNVLVWDEIIGNKLEEIAQHVKVKGYHMEIDSVVLSGIGRFVRVAFHDKAYYIQRKAKLEAEFAREMMIIDLCMNDC